MQSHDILPGTGIPSAAPPRPGLSDAEAALVEHYPRLVRLAHLILPPALGRHRRVLAAHALVQKSLAAAGPARPRPRVPAPRGAREPVLAWLRQRVVSAALRAAARPRWSLRRAPLPAVLGLRVFPRAGGDDETALEAALAAVTPEVRAAFALRVLEGLADHAAAALLAGAGVPRPDEALRAAEHLRATVGADAESLLHGVEFDPCTVQARPTDLLRRRRRARVAGLAATVLLAATTAAVLTPRPAPPAPAPPAGAVTAASARAADPALLLRTPAERWADTARVDLSAWPARGSRTGDTALLSRALGAWARGTGERTGVPVTVAPGTTAYPPVAPARLLFAGPVDGSAVVLLHDGGRLVRYAEPLTGAGGAELHLARADDADVTAGAAVAVSRTPRGARFLLAPWIDESAVRDLLRPGVPARRLNVSADGVTDPVPPAEGECRSAPALQVRSSTRIVEDHSFLLADLGELAPAHLTWTPAPGTGAPARQPREATSAEGLAAWARSACALPGLRGTGVRAVNRWEFARQALPEGAGLATWTCTRAERWDGRARVEVAWERPDARSRPTPVRAPGPPPPDTAACSRFGQHLLAGTYWTAPSGARYYLAAGSRALTAITARGPVSATVRGRVLAVRTHADGPVRLTGAVPGSGELRGWGEPERAPGGP
ncbi:hypothetical protein ACFYOG_28170 [Streptomyces sp. NPDC007818]|uniref:hypothetical protein n=1 Tax=Streptomyces sp. NPDC007818 TaxID=3364780 RepID=UPI00368F8110